jgi:thioredoxin reductase (NADPH)
VSELAAGKPVLVAIDDDADALGRVRSELERRFGSDYRIVTEDSGSSGLAELEALKADGADVAVVLADQWMPGLSGSELLSRVRGLFPRAQRGLLVEWGAWGDPPTADAVLRAMALGHMDYYVLKPWQSPDELFHRTIAEFVHEWSRSATSRLREVTLVARSELPRTHELRSLLSRNGVPYAFHDCDTQQGAELLDEVRHQGETEPVVLTKDGRVLIDPTNAELARAYGMQTGLKDKRDYDVIVVGAGPSGLSAAVASSAEGMDTLVIEGESIGGQAGSSSLIRNYLGFSRGITGAELAQRAYQQAWVFGSRFVLMRRATALRPEGDHLVVTLSDGAEATAQVVVLATGVTYRRLRVPALEELVGSGVFYGASISQAQALAGQKVYIVGGGNSAGQAAMHLSRHCEHVTLVIRSSSLTTSMSAYLIHQIDVVPNIDVRVDTEVVDADGDGRLEHLTLRHRGTGLDERVEAAALLVMIGGRPRSEWLPDSIERDERGFLVTDRDISPARWALGRQPYALETSLPGVFAVGDVRKGSVKRVASAAGEGAIVAPPLVELVMDAAADAEVPAT